MNYAALAAEIANDPQHLGYAAFLPSSPGGVCDLLNSPTQPFTGSVPLNIFAIWCAQTGMRAIIEDKSTAGGDPLRSSALAMLDFMRGSVSASLDLSNTSNIAMLQAWVSAGALSQENHDALIALAATKVSRAQILGLTPAVEIADLRAAGVNC